MQSQGQIKGQAGFTLVELIVVIVILGILAAVAVPRFMGLETEARIAAVKSMGGTLKTAANMAHGVCMAQACANGGAGIVIEGQNIVFANGYPNAASIAKLVQSSEGFTTSAGGNRLTKSGARTNNCWVQYNNAAVVNGVVQPPTITYQNGVQIIDAATEAQVNGALRQAC